MTSEFQISNKKYPVVYLKFKHNWVPYILSGNPVLNKPLQNSMAENREVDGCPRAQRSAVWDGRLQAGLGGALAGAAGLLPTWSLVPWRPGHGFPLDL